MDTEPTAIAEGTSAAPAARPSTEDPRVGALAVQMLAVRRPEAEPADPAAQAFDLDIPTSAEWSDAGPIRVRVRRRGEGPPALVVHGLQGRPSDLGQITDALLAAGYSVWTPDLPGHGDSTGAHLSIPLAARVLRAVGALAGPFHVAIAHSIGGACLVQALDEGLQVGRVVLLAVPTHFGHFVRLMGRKAGLDALQQDDLLRAIGRRIGMDPDHIDMARQAAVRREPALFIHSEDDPIVAFQGARRVASIWPGADWTLVQSLGHTRPFLDDPGVLERIRRFVPAPEATRSHAGPL